MIDEASNSSLLSMIGQLLRDRAPVPNDADDASRKMPHETTSAAPQADAANEPLGNEPQDGSGVAFRSAELDFRFADTPKPAELNFSTEPAGADFFRSSSSADRNRTTSGDAIPIAKLKASAEEISELILMGLRQSGDFPKIGVALTIYGFGAGWNAMLTFSPGSTTLANATVYRKILPELVAELRKQFELV